MGGYDPCCGSGGMFVQSMRFIENHSGNINQISVYGQDSNPTTWKLAQMNLAIRGIDADLGRFNADTFFNDCHPTLRADFVMANPPFNLSDWGVDKLGEDPRWQYGLPPAGNANFAWLQHMIYHLAPGGRIGMVLANGSLSSQSGGEGDIQRIADTYNAFAAGTPEDVKGFCAVADTEETARQDYILTPGRYVGIEEQGDDGEPFEEKMGRLTAELAGLFEKSHELEKEIRQRLGEIGYEV